MGSEDPIGNGVGLSDRRVQVNEEMRNRVSRLEARIQRLDESLHGNGSTGLKTEVHTIKNRLATLTYCAVAAVLLLLGEFLQRLFDGL